MASCSWIASRLAEDLKDYPDLNCYRMRTILRKSYGVSVPNTKLWRARHMAKGGIVETHAIEFVILRCYAKMVLKTNIRSVVKIQRKLLHIREPPEFKRFFFCAFLGVVLVVGHS